MSEVTRSRIEQFRGIMPSYLRDRIATMRRYWNLYWIVVRDQVEFLGFTTPLLRTAVWLFSLLPALPIAWRLLKFDRLIYERGLVEAADWLLNRYYRGYSTSAISAADLVLPSNYRGELLYANHVGLADVLALLSWWNRSDAYIITKERALIRALPALSEHVISIGNGPAERRQMLQRLVQRLAEGARVVLFPAGRIENDPWFLSAGEPAILEWSGLIGYLLGYGRKQGFRFTLQPVLTGNVYAPVSRSFYSVLVPKRRSLRNDRNKYLAFFTFIFRLGRYQPLRLIPDRVLTFEDIPAEHQGKKAITEFFRNRLIMLAGTVTRYSGE